MKQIISAENSLKISNSPKKHNKIIGNLGEDLACKFLMKHGFEIIMRNYKKKCGEIDIIGSKNSILHFIEVKSVSHENVPRRTITDSYRPEENVTKKKMEKISKTIQLYFIENKADIDREWRFDVITVILDQVKKSGKVTLYPDITL